MQHDSGSHGQALFREAALKHSRELRHRPGDLLRLSPWWANWTYRLLLVLVAAAMVFALIGELPEYAEGPAIIIQERVPVTIDRGGTIRDVLVLPGAAVEARRQVASFESQDAPRQVQWVRARHDGIITEIRVRKGQHVSAGDTLMWLVEDNPDQGALVLAVLPARCQSMLLEGQKLRLELSGYKYAHQELTVKEVEAAAIGPSALREYLAREDLADALVVQGSVVLVKARLERGIFSVGDVDLKCHHGMTGTATVRVRSQRIIRALIKGLLGDGDA